MKDLFRESVFGRSVRLLSGGKLFAYSEETDPSLLERYQLSHTKSSSTSLSLDGKQTNQESGGDSGAELGKPTTIAEQEKGVDHLLVDWSPNDPDYPRNWSTPKKLFVTFQICFLTTSVYIGSAIYTAGLPGVEEQFHISPVKALLGLTLFVFGYALGPMIWVCSLYAP